MYLISSPSYNGYEVLSQRGPLIENILIINELVLVEALRNHNRVAVMHFVLKFPNGFRGNIEIISKFFDSLRCKIKNDLERKTGRRGRTIYSEIGYVWAKELSSKHGWHYHVALVLNYDVYRCFGRVISDKSNMYNRILSSWASAMGCYPEEARGLVHIPVNPVYKLDYNSITFFEDIHEILRRLSYLAKLRTKPYGEGYRMRFYGTSVR